MTLPHERTRATISTREFLFAICSPYGIGGIKGIPKDVRDRALRLLKHYPTPWDLHAAAKAEPDVFDANETLRWMDELSERMNEADKLQRCRNAAKRIAADCLSWEEKEGDDGGSDN